MKTRYLIAGPATAVVLLLLVFFFLQPVHAVGEPPMVRTETAQHVLLFNSMITETPGTADSTSALVDLYTGADVFVTATFSGTGMVTATVQFSADDENYADGYFRYADADSLDTVTYQLGFSSAGTKYLRVPVAGRHMRVTYVTDGIAGSEGVTPMTRVVLKN